MFTAGNDEDWEAVIHRLLEMNDQGSARLAFEMLRLVGLCAVSGETSILTVLAYFGLGPNRNPEEQSNELKYVPDSFLSGLEAGWLASWLDDFGETARPLTKEAGFNAEWHVTRLVRRLTAQVLEADPAIEPERVWEWINWLDRHHGYNDDENKRLIGLLRENRALRSGLIEHVLLTPCAQNTWMAGYRLFDIGLDLYPKAEDVAGALNALRVKAGDGAIDRDTWRGLLMLGRTGDGIPAVVRDTAVEIADGEPELLSILDELSESPAAEWEAKRAARDAEQEARRQAVYQAHRHILADRKEQVAAGDVHVLAVPAGAYLGRAFVLGEYGDFDPEASPHERVCEFLGDELAGRVMSGFMAVLERDDLPSASKIAEDHCRNDHGVDETEAAMICGLAEMLRRGHAVDRVDREVLAAVYMAWQRAPEANNTGLADIGPALEVALFRRESDWEFHFWTSIEPQLARNTSNVSELYRLENDPQVSTLAGRLSVDWLRAYPELNIHTQTKLLACALKHASDEEKRDLVVEGRNRVHRDDASKLLWLSADYVVDLVGCREALNEAAADDRDLIWVARDRIGPENGERFDRFSLDHLVFIVEAFGKRWPNVQRPAGVMMGDCNPSDASQFIRHTIYAMASLPSPAATKALQHLISDHATSYVEILKHALALQRRVRRDAEYAAPKIDELRAVMANALPESMEDMQAWFGDRLEELQGRMRASDTNMWAAYWTEDRCPRHEDYCRDRLVEHISGSFPQSMRLGPEMRMPLSKRADIALTRNAMKLPVEIKGQWHSEVWNAASDQLDAKYAVDWQAEGRGTYVVFWFGDVPGKRLPRHPEGLEPAASPGDLRRMLIERLPEARRRWIDVVVMDVSRPAGP